MKQQNYAFIIRKQCGSEIKYFRDVCESAARIQAETYASHFVGAKVVRANRVNINTSV